MNELHAKFESKGLSIVGVTYENKKKTEPWIQRHGVEHPYAYDPGKKLQSWFGINGIPHAVLVDSFGTIVWRGHPAYLTDEMVESALLGAFQTPVHEWPADAAPVVASLKLGDLPAALDSARSSSAKIGSTPVATLLEGRIKDVVGAVENAFDSGDLLTASRRGASAAAVLGNLPEGRRVQELMKRLESEPKLQKALAEQRDAERELAKLLRQAGKVRRVSEAQEICDKLDEFAKRYAGTNLGADAAREAAGLRKRIKRSTG